MTFPHFRAAYRESSFVPTAFFRTLRGGILAYWGDSYRPQQENGRVIRPIVEPDRYLSRTIGACGLARRHRSRRAQKKGGGTFPPPPAPGLIYFTGWVPSSNSTAPAPMSMNEDGTDKRTSSARVRPATSGTRTARARTATRTWKAPSMNGAFNWVTRSTRSTSRTSGSS